MCVCVGGGGGGLGEREIIVNDLLHACDIQDIYTHVTQVAIMLIAMYSLLSFATINSLRGHNLRRACPQTPTLGRNCAHHIKIL